MNIRGIRCMAFEGIFNAQIDSSVNKALTTAEALLYFVGAVLVSRGLYTYLQMVEVLNLVVFSVTIGSQLMAFFQ